MPAKKQIDSNKSVSSFNPVMGGHYSNGTLFNEDTGGIWWGSDTYGVASRYYLLYNDSGLSISYGGRRLIGFYIRCVSEEKTVTDLTYMQDMTPKIAPALSLCI